MPLIDVTDLLGDPDFAEAFSIIRIASVVGSNGRATLAETTEAAMGVVQPAGSAARMGADSASVSDTIEVHTTSPLSAVTSSAAADHVLWRGKRYAVRLVNDWSQYGAGFHHAICDLRDLTA